MPAPANRRYLSTSSPSHQRSTPRWIIFLSDVGITFFALACAYLLRFNFSVPAVEIETFSFVFPTLIGVRMLSFLVFRTYAGIIRYTSSKDAQRIAIVLLAGSIFFCLINLVRHAIDGKYVIPFSIIGIEFLATSFIMVSLRVAVKVFYFEIKNPNREKDKVIIFGAGDSGIITKRTLDRDEKSSFRVVAFVDDDKHKAGNKIEGIPVYHSDRMKGLLENATISHLIISIQHLSNDRKREVAEEALKNNVEILSVPDVRTWINGELSFHQIHNIRIEDLLGRRPIKLNTSRISSTIEGKNVMVTGAAGSIGSELVRQISKYNPDKIIMLDQAESGLFEIERDMIRRARGKCCESVIGDICDPVRMRRVFESFDLDIVFHAAAYKHVPLMELNPTEAVKTNVLGTEILASLAVEFKLDKFVMISTDKAVNPTGVMGASKRIAEQVVQVTGANSETQFITTRFGNVLGSNGSVIPIFQKQINEGGPVLVTDPAVTRFFMTIPEACQLVLEAAVTGNGGEIFLFDMGERVRILDLAKKMIKLAGLRLGKDIEIQFTGLRPGEKLHEELLADQENNLPTHHKQIMIARTRETDREQLHRGLDELRLDVQRQDNLKLVQTMKELVPEFRSAHSDFENLDQGR